MLEVMSQQSFQRGDFFRFHANSGPRARYISQPRQFLFESCPVSSSVEQDLLGSYSVAAHQLIEAVPLLTSQFTGAGAILRQIYRMIRFLERFRILALAIQ